VLSGLCRTELYKADIGPYAQNADLGTLTITVPVQSQLTLKGAVTNCTGTNVTNGFVTVAVDGIKYSSSIIAGKYSVSVARCNTAATKAVLTAYDVTTGKYNTDSVSVTSGTTTLDIKACDNTVDILINLTINNQAVQYVMPADTISTAYSSGNYFTVYGSRRKAPKEEFSFSFYSSDTVKVAALQRFGYKNYWTGFNNPATVNSTKVNNLVMEGNAQGSVIDSTSSGGGTTIVPFSLTFKVLNR
jgi:hypothetical protein